MYNGYHPIIVLQNGSELKSARAIVMTKSHLVLFFLCDQEAQAVAITPHSPP